MRLEPERIRTLRDAPPAPNGRYVLYWMQQAQRAAHNPALEHAVSCARELDQGVLVAYGLDEAYPEANERSFAFLLEGLAETARVLAQRGIKLVLHRGPGARVAAELAEAASCVVCDRGYLRAEREARATLAKEIDRRLEQIEGDVVVPIDEVSDHAEFAARTIRPKIGAKRDRFIRSARVAEPKPARSSLPLHVTGDLDPNDVDGTLAELEIDRSVSRVSGLRGGTCEARRRLTRFLRYDLPGYADRRNDPAEPRTSGLSPYLHFGQISPVEIAWKVSRSTGASAEDRDAFLEELIVRRELARNFVEHTRNYDAYGCLPEWARKTLDEHTNDERPHRYTARQLEDARTHDPAWNAAMTEMKRTGMLANYMRMYWGKKILQWCNTPEYAFRVTLELNNRYLLDGRDASSYANVAWIFGLHDRAWPESKVFGKVRRMTASGLERKFDVESYVARVAALEDGA